MDIDIDTQTAGNFYGSSYIDSIIEIIYKI
jgi:hypothetical protein